MEINTLIEVLSDAYTKVKMENIALTEELGACKKSIEARLQKDGEGTGSTVLEEQAKE